MHNDAPQQFLLAVLEFLDVLPEQWMGKGGPTAKPVRTFHKNPLIFNFGGHIKYNFYDTEVNDVQYLQQRTQNGT